MEASVRLLFYVRTEFIVVIQNILALIAMAGKDIRDQRFRIRNNQGILIRHPLYLAKILFKDIPAILPAKPLIQLIRGQHNSFIKSLHEPADFHHVPASICAADESSVPFEHSFDFSGNFRDIFAIKQHMIGNYKIKVPFFIRDPMAVEDMEFKSLILRSNGAPCIPQHSL